MESSVQDIRALLKLAANLRRFAADVDERNYVGKFLRTAIELEMRAEFLAGHRAGEPEPDWELEEARHAPVDLRI
ncbi:MAG: hypothetical protein ABI963_02680 [Rhizomicrobium sp.]